MTSIDLIDPEDLPDYAQDANPEYVDLCTFTGALAKWGSAPGGNMYMSFAVDGETENRMQAFKATQYGGRSVRVTVEVLSFDGFEVEGG